jgi:hypothetical protein
MGVMIARGSLLRFAGVLCALLAGLVFAGSAFAASAPVIGGVWASEVNRSTARINANVNPSEADTTYRFEYGPDTSYGSSVPVPDGDLGSGSEGVEVSEFLTGLQAGGTYHYRVVAINSSGTTPSEDGTFSTFSASSPEPADTCPNAAYRVGASAGLPDCRAYEMVSPVVKNGGDVSGEAFGQTISSDSGERVEFMSKVGFGEVSGSGNAGYSQYVAERRPDGWVSRGITPTPNVANGGQVFGYKTEAMEFSSDLSIAGVIGYSLPEGPSTAMPNSENLYLQDTLTGKLPVALTDGSGDAEPFPSFLPSFFRQIFGKPVLGGATPSLGVVTFMSRLNFLPEADGSEFLSYKAYVYEHGTLKMLGVLPDGSIPPGGSKLANGGESERGRDDTVIETKDTVSTDGSRILFEVNELPGQIFMRKNGTESVMVSESETSEPVTAENVELWAATPDLKHIVFRTSTRLLDSAPEGDGLYMYTDGPSPQTESNLTYIGAPRFGTASPQVITAYHGEIVLGISDDGTRVYYHTGNNEVFLWEAGQTHHIANSEYAGSEYASSTGVTADGGELAFVTTRHSTEEAGNMYVYSAGSNTLKCVSCPPTGVATTLGVETEVHANNGGTQLSEPYRPRFMSSDGRFVFFSTVEALVPRDTNGVADAYEYDTVTGQLSLLSTGTGEDGAWFVEASADGHDAFLVTRQKLTRWDPDKLVDVYDVRIDGGLPEPPVPGVPCAGDACQGTPSASPSFNTASGFSGLGNPSFATAVKAKTRAKPNGRLRHALAVCHRKPKRKRAGCERGARKRYGARVSSAHNTRSGR